MIIRYYAYNVICIPLVNFKIINGPVIRYISRDLMTGGEYFTSRSILYYNDISIS